MLEPDYTGLNQAYAGLYLGNSDQYCEDLGCIHGGAGILKLDCSNLTQDYTGYCVQILVELGYIHLDIENY